MALSFSSKITLSNRIFRMFGGLHVKVVDMTVGATTDYSTTGGSEGFDITGNDTLMGFRTILAVLGASIRQSAGTHRIGFVPNYNYNNGRLRFVENAAGAGALDEMDQADLANGDIVRMVVLGL